MNPWQTLPFLFFLICSCQSDARIVAKKLSLLEEFNEAKQIALTDAPKACEIFKKLSDKKEFILADVAYIKSLALCSKEAISLDRSVPPWLEKEKQLAVYSQITTVADKAVYITQNPQYFPSPERIKMYQQALAGTELTEAHRPIVENALYAIAPRFRPDPKLEHYFQIVRDLRSIRDLEKAKDLLHKIIKDPASTTEDRLRAYKEIFVTSKLQRRQKNAAYIKSAKDWADFLKPNRTVSPALLSGMYDAKLNYVRVLWTEKGTAQGLKALEKIRREMQGKVSLYDVYWLKAHMLEEKKLVSQAVIEYEKALKEKIPQWRDQEKILWSLTWIYIKIKNFTAAKTHLQELIDNKDTSPYARFKYLYWQAECFKELNEPEEAKLLWKRVSDEDTFGYYGLLSLYQLSLPLRKMENATDLARGLSDRDDEVFKALQLVQETELASRFLASVLPDSTSIQKSPVTDISSILKLYAEVKNYKYVFQLFNQLPFEVQREVFAKIPDVLFPQPYAESIAKAAAATQVEPELIYSIMRQESAFDPNARSPMDALGLVQVLPSVAKRIAQEFKIPLTTADDLYKEDINILVGSYLLKKQSQKFDNKFPLYVASYNASGNAVREWHKRFSGGDVMFIEEIPYEETKVYVKLVMRNFVIYKKLKQGDAFEFFPRELINIQ
jgi:soluble lytic murein transglycosylase